MPNKKSTGHDGISTETIKILSAVISPTLSIILNKYIVVAVELVPQRVNRQRSFSTLMLTLGDIVLVRLASNIIRYGCNGNILIFRKSSLIRYNLFNYYYTQGFTY